MIIVEKYISLALASYSSLLSMNYLRGAVNAISAPYQYYKDINPSTLTGAIDVIVISRPADNGDTELVCSPFHVRFGKWQVLRPSEKKVNVFVNGNQIPFDMKIGEAGEAFFVFETDEDVPADLITSPILQPTVPPLEKDEKQTTEPVAVERYGGEGVQEPSGNGHVEREPTFLDLNGGFLSHDVRTTPKQTHYVPKSLRKQDSKATISPAALPSPPHSRERSAERAGTSDSELRRQDKLVDAALSSLKLEPHTPEVEYHSDIALDMEGYKQPYHYRDASSQTVRPLSTQQEKADGERQCEFPRSSSPPSLHNAPQHPMIPQIQSELSTPFSPSPPSSPSSSRPHSPSTSQLFRATSEPPPEIQVEDVSHPIITIQTSPSTLQEYSWEWGAFPQPSPLKPSFSKGGRLESPKIRQSEWKGRLALSPATKLDELGEEQKQHTSHGRSRSVPPGLEGSPIRKKGRPYKEYEDFENSDDEDEDDDRGRRRTSAINLDITTGCGGTLSPSDYDSTQFHLSLDGKTITFQLSLVSFDDVEEGDGMTQLFDQYRVDFSRFLHDESVIQDPRLVVRWDGNQYIRRRDGSPIMEALALWRHETLRKRTDKSASPLTLEESNESSRRLSKEGNSGKNDATMTSNQPVNMPEPPVQEPSSLSSSSWVQWWRSSRKNQANGDAPLSQADRSSASLPLPSRDSSKGIPLDARSEPATPLQRPTDNVFEPSGPTQTPPVPPPTKTKYAKTLRLTSDQLKSLNLKPGANSITFSLSASGASATTARIFVWESSDLVVISDIDGTITKSDGLGHVFAMIGRDWTHSGVAKLYTDIVRNGYKVLYLTSRAIGQADATRFYLRGVKQNNYQLPDGPVIMSPDRLMASLHREVIMRKPEVFKMACLRDIQRLFGEITRNSFYAGFGNRITDALSYRTVNVPSARIFTIDHTGEVKMELLELAGYKSSYIHMTALVDQMFPPIHRKWTSEFTDFNYWKTPVQDFPLPDLTPPSPALSARSDTSGQSAFARLRNFSLAASKQQTVVKQISVSSLSDEPEKEGGIIPRRSSHLRQMSSLEKLGSTLGFVTRASTGRSLSRSASPSSSSSYYESDDDDAAFNGGGRRHKLGHRKSMASMPGMLDDMHYDLEDDGVNGGDEQHFFHEEDDEDGEYEGEEDEQYQPGAEEEAEDAFDDDILATGEMQKVPFL